MAQKSRGKQTAKCSRNCKQKAHQQTVDRPKSKTRKLLLVSTTALFQILPHFNTGSDAFLNMRDLYQALFN